MAGHPGAGFWIFAALCGVLALLALIACFSRLRRDRFIADTPLVPIRSAAQGYVRVAGIARSPPGETMRSPLTDRPCVWWDYRVEAREENAKGEAVYRTVGRWLKGVYPVSTGIVVAGLARPEWLVEVDVIAVIPDEA